MKKLLGVILAVVLLFGVEYTKEEKEFLKNNPVIYISAVKYWPLDETGNSVHTNFLHLINKYGKLNLKPVFFTKWSEAYESAKNGKTAGILALSYSEKRTKYFYYTPPYNFTPYYIVVNKNSHITSVKDLKGKTVHVAKNSIIREALKGEFNVVNVKGAFKKLAEGKIDAIMLFYMPKNDYSKKFKIIKTYIDRYGEEHLGISKHYPVLYSIVNKVINQIPYNEIEKIRHKEYKKEISVKSVLDEGSVNLKEIISVKDIVLLVVLVVLIGIILFLYASKIFLNMKIKDFFISMSVIYMLVVGIMVLEVVVYRYFSDKLVKIKSENFNALYVVTSLSNKLNLINIAYLKEMDGKKVNLRVFFDSKESLLNLKIKNIPLRAYLTSKYFDSEEIEYITNLSRKFDEIVKVKNEIIKKRIPKTVYEQKFITLITMLEELKNIVKNNNDKEMVIIQNKLRYQFVLLIVDIVILVLLSAFLFLMIKRKIYDSVKRFDRILGCDGDEKKCQLRVHNDEIGEFIKEFMKLKKTLEEKIQELKEHKSNLEEKIKKEVNIRMEQEKLLMKQSRLALMGEMIDAIAHQWKQPLNAISIKVGMLLMDKDEIDEEYLNRFVDEIYMQIEHMTSTLEEFRRFFREDKREIFCMKRIVNTVLLLLKDELTKNNIEVETDIKSNFCIEGNENEFKHLLIVILTNAKEIFNERGVKERKVIIKTYEDGEYYYLSVKDTGGGISEDIINRIFEPNFTTREGGTGVGLYLASKIALKHTGILKARNWEKGAEFIFKIKK